MFENRVYHGPVGDMGATETSIDFVNDTKIPVSIIARRKGMSEPETIEYLKKTQCRNN